MNRYKLFIKKQKLRITNIILANNNHDRYIRDKIRQKFREYASIVVISFAFGVLVSSFTSFFVTNIFLSKKAAMQRKIANYADTSALIPVVTLTKNVTDRNLFNKDGSIPYEDTPEGNASFDVKNFEKAPCSVNEKLPVELVGIIYTGNPKTNLVTLKDPKVSIADIYKEGEQLIDYETYSLSKVINSANAVFRRGSIKICATLNPQQYNTNSNASPGQSSSDIISLNTSFVTEQLGPGFATILNSARMVPQIVDGKTLGFKIFAIAKNSLFDKIQLVNGDVIKSVNGINLEDSSQGFKIYEAFQTENNIAIEIERNGDTLTKRISVQ